MRERKRADNRAATIETAFRLFGERGYDEVTVADICVAADIGRRTFFRYFASKEDLLNVPVQEMTARLAASISAAPPGCTDGQAVRAAMADIAQYTLDHRAQFGLYRRIVTTTSHALRLSAFWYLPEQEQRFAERVYTRGGRTGAPDLATRLLVARAVAAFRIWVDEVIGLGVEDVTDADAHRLFGRVFDGDPHLAPAAGPSRPDTARGTAAE